MPYPNPRRPPRPPPPSPEQLALRAARKAYDDWREAARQEAWRLVFAEGRRAAGSAEFRRGEQSLIDQGYPCPPNPDAR